MIESSQIHELMQANHCRGVLLTSGTYYGTLAAARELGALNVPLCVAGPRTFTQTGYSRFVSHRYQSPSSQDIEAYVEWLLDFGHRQPGYFLYPTSDDLCWIIAHYQQELSRNFFLYQPPAAVTNSFLNKEKFYRLAARLGIDHPQTVFPKNLEEVQNLAPSLTYPTFIKPKTQAGLRVPMKGEICDNPAQLLSSYAMLQKKTDIHPLLVQQDPTLSQLMIQSFHPEAASHIISVAGFIPKASAKALMRSSTKVVQIPRKVGVGLCFESRPVLDFLAERILKLCREIGYYGVFEAEFIHLAEQGRYLLIDFNSRFYGQMGFEIHRNIPQSLLALLGGLGADGVQAELLATLEQQAEPSSLSVYRRNWMLKLLLWTQWLSGNVRGEVWQQWRRWSQHEPGFDQVYAEDDTKPFWIDVILALHDLLRYPRSSLRMYFR